MITEQQLNEQTERVKAIGEQIEALAMVFHEESDKLKQMVVTWKLQSWVYGEEAKAVMNTEAPTKSAQNGANQAVSDAPRMVHVDWSGRGHSSGSYRVLADTGDYLKIAFDLDVTRTMTVSKTKTRAA